MLATKYEAPHYEVASLAPERCFRMQLNGTHRRYGVSVKQHFWLDKLLQESSVAVTMDVNLL